MDIPAGSVDYESLLLENLDVVKQAVQYVARRYCLSADERDELLAAVHLKLVERDYEVLRKFQRSSSLRTYLNAVVLHHFLDDRNACWGKWRPSRVARKLGGVALKLDELLTRDGFSLDEAIDLLRTNYGVSLSRDEIVDIARQLPPRTSRHFVGEEALEDVPAPTASLDGTDSERGVSQIEDGLSAALAACSEEDLLILRYHFDAALQISTVARLMGVPQKPLYRRLEKLIQRFRSELEARGVSRGRVLEVLDGGAVDFRPLLALATSERRRAGPSHD